MADIAKTIEIIKTAGKSVFILSATSDGSGESAVTKVNISDLPGVPTRVRIREIQYSCEAISVGVYFDRTSAAVLVYLNGSGCIKEDIIDALNGLTGDIKFTTTPTGATGGGYTIRMVVEADPS